MPQSYYDNDTGNYGFKDEQGVIVIPPIYDQVEDFSYGVAVVQIDELLGLIDGAGNVILPCAYDSIFVFRGGWVQARKKEVHYLYTMRGEEVLHQTDILYWHTPEKEFIRVKRQTGWGCINLKGETVIPFQYTSLGPYRNGWFSFFENGRWGWLDQHGMVVIPAVFAEVGVWSNQLWWGRNQDGYTLYDFEGSRVRSEGWQKILLPLESGMSAAKTAAGWKFMDANFNTVLQLPPVYEWIDHYSEGLAAVKQNGVWGFIDTMGKEVIKPVYKKAENFNEGLAAVQIGRLWGFINTAGKMVIPCTYHEVSSFRGGRAWVCDTWCEWYINHQGEDVSERKYMDY